MDLRALRAFVEVVRRGGFSAAAKALYSTQPTVSKAVRQLEDEIGLPLVDRLGHGVQVTAAGDIVYRRAVTMLAEREHMLDELSALKGLERGALRIGFPLLGSSLLFAPLFAAYRARHPGVEILMQEHGSTRLEEAVRAGELELAVSLLPVDEGEFACLEVRDEPLIVLLPPDHRLSGQPRIRLADLADSPFILFEGGFALNRLIGEACHRRGFTPTEAARSGQVDFIVALVAAGLGVALLPRLDIERWLGSSVRVALLDEQDLRWRAALVWRRGADLSPAAKAWLRLAEAWDFGGVPMR